MKGILTNPLAITTSLATPVSTVSSPISVNSGLFLNCIHNQRITHRFSHHNFKWVFKNSHNLWRIKDVSFGCRTVHMCCQTTQTGGLQKRRCAPLLEHEILSNTILLGSSEWKVVPDIWRTGSEKYGDRTALVDRYHDPPSELSYKQLELEILDFSEGLRVAGLEPDEKIALFADNSCRWLIADQGVMAMGAVSVVRGSRSSSEELLQIYSHSESVALIVDSPQLFNRMAESFLCKETMQFVVLLWGEKSDLDSKVSDKFQIFNYSEITEMGRGSRKLLVDSPNSREQYIYEPISTDDVATLMYTSGTSGNPKGVMITHRNFLHQIKSMWDIVPIVAGDRFLSVLPPWHAYERACEYFCFTCGVEQVYTSVKYLKEDLRIYQPDYLISVPLIYEILYSAIQKQISTSSASRRAIALAFIKISMLYMDFKRIYEGAFLSKNQLQPPYLIAALDCLWARIAAVMLWPFHLLAKKLVYSKIQSAVGISKAGISGGGSIPQHIDKFFEAIGILVQNGYGMTECSPVVTARRPSCNVLGSVGHPLRLTEVKVVDSGTNEALSPGSKGIVKVRGPQVMKGYYKNPSASKAVLDSDGWLNTGDLGWIAPCHSSGRSRLCGGVLVLEGRAKDTIVLSTGENVEPSEIEESATKSSLIQQIVVIGQDQRRLGAIIVPNKEAAMKEAKKLSMVETGAVELSRETLMRLLREQLKTWLSGSSFQVGPILVVDEPFTIENGLMTPTMKIRRDQVNARYSEEIANLYK